MLRSNLKINENHKNVTNNIEITSNHKSPINSTIITDDSVDDLKEEIDDKLTNLQNIDEAETPKITINGPCLSTENFSFSVSVIENASTVDVPADSDNKEFLLKECEIKLEPMALAEFHDEYSEENMTPGNYLLCYF